MKMNNLLTLFLAVSMFLTACSSANKDQAKGAGNDQPQSYSVIAIDKQNTTLESDYPASLEGQQNVDIRPKIDGFVEKIFVDEGATVKKGQSLFLINAPQYQEEVTTAKAAIKSAEADVNVAQLQYNKTKPLVDKDIISKYDLENAALVLTTKKAALAQAKAALANAQTNLSYTMVTAPMDGVIGTFPYRVGALVSSNIAEPLTTISNIAKVYAYFSLNEKQLLEIAREYKGTTLESKVKQIAAVQLILADGTVYPEKGKIESISGQINPATGASGIRATFNNPNGLLRSGSSASIRIPQHLTNAILVPQKSTVDIQGKKFVYLLGDSNKVVSTNIEIMDLTPGNLFVVTKGLKPGDKIVLDGLLTLKDGAKISPVTKPTDSVYTTLKNQPLSAN